VTCPAGIEERVAAILLSSSQFQHPSFPGRLRRLGEVRVASGAARWPAVAPVSAILLTNRPMAKKRLVHARKLRPLCPLWPINLKAKLQSLMSVPQYTLRGVPAKRSDYTISSGGALGQRISLSYVCDRSCLRDASCCGSQIGAASPAHPEPPPAGIPALIIPQCSRSHHENKPCRSL